MPNNESFNPVRSGLSKRANDLLGIPVRYRRLSLENFEGADNDIAAARSAISRSAGVLISGPCGVGKTHLAVGLLLDWYAAALAQASNADDLSPRAKGQFVSAADLAIELAEVGKRGEAPFLRKYDVFDCLLLDDLGAELSTDRSRHVFGTLIDSRYRRTRRTLITSNMTLQEIGEFYDDRTASRINGMCVTMALEGPDRRVLHESEQQVGGI